METALKTAIVVLPLAYLLVAMGYGLLFFAGSHRAGRMASAGLRAAVLLHVLYLVLLTVRWGQFPAATVSQVLTVVALAVAVVYSFVEWHGRERGTGFWMVSLVVLFQVLSLLLHRPNPPAREIFNNPFVGAHVALALLGYTGFAVAAAYGFLFLELYRDLKAGKFSTFFGKLPPLEALERMMSGALLGGFLALGGALVLGVVWAQQLYPDRWFRDPKFLLTLCIWCLYGAALILRRLRRWQGRQTAIACLAGLTAILISLLAVNLFLTNFHTFG